MEKNIKELIGYSKDGITSKDLVKTDKINSTLFCMAAGTQISEHTSTKQGYVHILEGEGVFNLEGEDIEMKEGVFIFMNENAKHSLKVSSDTSFVLTLV